MYDENAIILYIILKQSLGFDDKQIAYCAANAVEHILLKYFTLQVLAVKHKPFKINGNIDCHLSLTTNWLATHSKKHIMCVEDDIWSNIRDNFKIGLDVFCVKSDDKNDSGNTMVFWPDKYANIPSYLKLNEK